MVLADRRVDDPPLPVELRAALREWAAVAATVGDSDEQAELVGRRGRQLAGWVAQVQGRSVDYLNPVTGTVEPVAARALSPEPAGPTPWATGLPISAFFAVLVAIGDVALCTTFAAAFGLFWVPANLLVTLGLAPSLWLLRTVPLWRWVSLGAAVGLGVAWVVLLLGLLG